MSNLLALRPANEDTTPKHLQEKGLRFACTEVGNSERFISQHGDRLRFIPETGHWIGWDPSGWSTLHTAEVWDFAKQTIRTIYDEAGDCKNTQGKHEALRWAWQSEREHQLRAMISLAGKDTRLAVSITDFDTDPLKVNCKNGIADLRTGELVKHSPDHLLLKQANVHYDAKAECPLWLSFLTSVFQEDQERISYMQRALGYSITGLTKEEVFFIAYGLGANGKTTLFETVLDIVGDHGISTEFDTFLNTDKTDVRNKEAIGRLKGRRYAIASETDSSKRLNEALLKKLTGQDTLIGGQLQKPVFSFQPTHKIWLLANHLPTVKDASHGFWRRVVVMPFNVRFEGQARDLNLREKLLRERDGIFAWLVEGAREYLKHGLGQVPKVCQAAVEEYKQDNDTLATFMRESTAVAKGHTIGARSLYDTYKRWAEKAGEYPRSEKSLALGLKERGYLKKDTNKGAVYLDLRLVTELPVDLANPDCYHQ
jgi:putative DNA primase/helicase